MGAVAAVAAGIRKQKEIVALFRAARATAPDRATTPAALGVHQGLAYRKLRGHAVLREASEGRLYLDEVAWTALQTRRRRLGLTILAMVLVGGLIAFALASRH
ncbi:MAG: hypothetical protein ACREMO_03270 [Gemmatimonadales bacterium]